VQDTIKEGIITERNLMYWWLSEKSSYCMHQQKSVSA